MLEKGKRERDTDIGRGGGLEKGKRERDTDIGRGGG